MYVRKLDEHVYNNEFTHFSLLLQVTLKLDKHVYTFRWLRFFFLIPIPIIVSDFLSVYNNEIQENYIDNPQNKEYKLLLILLWLTFIMSIL